MVLVVVSRVVFVCSFLRVCFVCEFIKVFFFGKPKPKTRMATRSVCVRSIIRRRRRRDEEKKSKIE